MGKNPLLLLQVLGGSFNFLQSQVLNLDIQTPPCVRVDLRVNDDGSQKIKYPVPVYKCGYQKIKYPVPVYKCGYQKIKYPVSIDNHSFQFL